MDLGMFDLGFLAELISDSGKASLAEKIFIVGLVWVVMGRKVSGHFKAIELGMSDGFAKLSRSIDEVKYALSEVEVSHAHKLDQLAKRVEAIETARESRES